MRISNRVIIISFLLFTLLSCNTEIKQDKDEILRSANKCYEFDNYKDALLLYNAYIESDTNSGVAYFNKGYCEKQLFDYENSTRSFKKAIELQYRIVDANYNIARNYAAELNDSLTLYYFKQTYKIDTTDKEVLKLIDFYTYRVKKNKMNK